MIMTPEQVEELSVAAKPLMAFLVKHNHPHCKIIVENDSAELVEGLAIIKSDIIPKSGD